MVPLQSGSNQEAPRNAVIGGNVPLGTWEEGWVGQSRNMRSRMYGIIPGAGQVTNVDGSQIFPEVRFEVVTGRIYGRPGT